MAYSEQTLGFFERVYVIVKLIPCGRVTSYGSIAKYLGSPKSSRMVGWAMNASHSLPDVPAHRVVNRLGRLTGKFHFGSSLEMQQRLEQEGIEVIQDQVQDFQKLFWNPCDKLNA